jgi:hypothetical protein
MNHATKQKQIIDQEIQHRKREAFIQELHSTEKTYIKSLELITEFYINPLRKGTKQSSFNFLGMKKMVCTEREMRWLFGNIQDILSAHHEIISSLEKR